MKVLRYQYVSFASSDASGITQLVEPCEQAFVNKVACVPFTSPQCGETVSHAH